MLGNYFKIAWRNITRHKLYSTINVLGLALGLCACLTLYLITHFELSFDRFHPDKDRIYHVAIGLQETNGKRVYFQSAPPPAPAAIRQEVPGIDVVAGFQHYRAKITVPDAKGPSKKFENHLEGSRLPQSILAEPQYFSIFIYQWLAGSAAGALNDPYKVVLTESRARKYFGNGPLDDMIGKTVIYDDSLFVQVSGIVRDWGKNTDFPFSDFISYSTIEHSWLKNSIQLDDWDQKDTWTLVKLARGVSPTKIDDQLSAMVKRHVQKASTNQGHLGNFTLSLQPLSNLHFSDSFEENEVRTADRSLLYGLMGIALFILILAIVNFINLSTAQSFQRAKEVGVRKVMGGSRMSLIFQFLTETFVITSLGLLLAISLINPVLAAFRSFIPPGVEFHVTDPSTIAFLVVVGLGTSLLAGLYPAKVLSGHLPVSCLKGSAVQKGHEKWYLRKGLIVFQFTVALIFIIGTLVISNQLKFIRSKDLGFSADAIVTVKPPWGKSVDKMKVLAEEITRLPGVGNVALESNSPMSDVHMGMLMTYKSKDVRDLAVARQVADENFVALYQMRLIAGRNVSPNDSLREFVINETCSRLLGFPNPQQAIGRLLYVKGKAYPVVGVVADFHQHSFHESIKPMCIVNTSDRKFEIAVKLISGGSPSDRTKATLALIEKRYKEIYPDEPFNYRFFDESIAQMYEKDRRTGWLMDTAMLVTIFISCMGLFGLAMYTAERRSKEIGIRKVLGASVVNIAGMLSKDFVTLILIAFAISSPISFYFMNRWLQDFAYRVDIGWWVFALAGLLAVLIALTTVSFQAVKAALANPINSLRSE